MMKYNALITTSQRVQERINSAYLIYFLAFNSQVEKVTISYTVMLATKLSNLTSTEKRKRKGKKKSYSII